MLDTWQILIIASALFAGSAYFFAGWTWLKLKTLERFYKIMTLPAKRKYRTEEGEMLGSHFS